MSAPLLALLSSFLSNPTEAAMKSAPLLPDSCLGCKTTVESSSEKNWRAGALIHPLACRLGDLGLTPITYREGGGGDGGGGIWVGAEEMAVFSLCTASLASFLPVKPLLLPSLLPTIIIRQFTLLSFSLQCSLTFYVCFTLCKLILSKPNSVPPPFFFIFLCLFVYPLSPHLFLSMFHSKLC